MAAFAEIFRAEITRLARKELKGEIETLRKGLASQRTEIASLKRGLKELAAEMRQVQRGTAAVQRPIAAEDNTVNLSSAPKAQLGKDFGPASFKACRIAFGMTQAQMAVLVQCSLASLVRWEQGAQPRGAALNRIASVMAMSKAKAWKTLSERTPKAEQG